MEATLNIRDYLKGRVAFDVSDSALDSICVYRKVNKEDDVDLISIEKQELCYADLLSWAATSLSCKSTTRDGDGGWKHENEESKTLSITDKKDMRAEAASIYKIYGDSRYKSNSTFKIVNL